MSPKINSKNKLHKHFPPISTPRLNKQMISLYKQIHTLTTLPH